MPFYFTCFTAALLALIPVAALAQTPPAPTPTASSAAPSEVLLKYKLTPGEVLRYRITDSMKGAMTVGSQNLPINDQSVESLTATVEKIDPATGNATLRQQFHTTETMSGKQSTNSSPSDISYSVVLAPTGQVISQDLGAKANAELKAIGWNFHSLLSSSYFSQDAAFPTHAVKIADIWSHADTLGQPGIPGYTNESLTGLGTISGHQTASIAERSVVTINFPVKVTAEHTLRFTGQSLETGTEQFDLDAGAIQSDSYTKIITYNCKVPPSVSPGNITLVGQMTETTKMERVGS